MVMYSIVLVIIGFTLLIKGADFLVDGASNLAKKMKIPEFVIGLTIVSIGTSLPEFFISLTSVFDGYQDITIGNVIGSNITNLLLILGVASTIKTVDIKKSALFLEIPMSLIFTLLFTLMCIVGQDITKLEASILLIIFICFVVYTIIETKQNREESTTEGRNTSNVIKDIFLIIIGIVALKIGGDLSVDNSVNIANYFGLSEKIISITILAIGTSLPELITTIVSAIKKNNDIAVGNILGSNLFNLLLIVGTSGMIRPFSYNISYNIDIIVLILATSLFFVFPFVPPKNKMGRREGILYLALYFSYLLMTVRA